jgi:hypothetical protein
MQVTMAVVFAGTLVLAALVGNSRERVASVELSDVGQDAAALTIRLPRNWAVNSDDRQWPINTVALEPPRKRIPDRRRIIVTQVKSAAGESSAQLLSKYLAQFEGDRATARALDFLGTSGVMTRFERLEVEPDDPYGGALIPGWYAAVVVPGGFPGGGGGDLGVVVSVEGYSADGPAGARLLRQVAGAMKLRGN